MNKNIKLAFLYIVSIILCLRLTLLYNYDIFYNLLPIIVCCSFILVLINYRKINKKWIKDNYLIIIYFIVRIISICVNDEKILNLKVLVYEAFFLIVVLSFFYKDKEAFLNTSKIIIIINLILNVISIIYQYIIQQNFNKELYGIYTNPNGLACYTILSIVLYMSFIMKDKSKIISCLYIIFSLIIILLSEARTPLFCIAVYVGMKLLLRAKIISFNNMKKIFNIILVCSICIILIISYIHRFNIYPTEFEEKLNDITTNRYYLWKYSIFSLEKNPILGIGDNNIGKYRIQYVNQEVIDSLNGERKKINRLSMNNNHNGYYQLLVGNGYICFIIFMLIILKKFKNMSEEDFFVVSSIMVTNLFENELILTPSIQIFMLMYILKRKEEKNV